ncbi:MAG: transaldolase, partial [Gammaproteobacteria bacterium]
MNELSYSLPPDLATAVDRELADWQRQDRVSRLWARDPSLWTGRDEAGWLGWLDSPGELAGQLDGLESFCEALWEEEFSHAVLLGMGGSSMAPEVLGETFGSFAGRPQLVVLDSTDPAQIRTVETAIDPTRSVFIVASKSGSTLEPNILKAWFFQRLVDSVGPDAAAGRFIAITDPGSGLEQLAGDEGFRQIFPGIPEIGGRFSALSNFGLVPAALCGIDVRRLLECTLEMTTACGADGPAQDHPGVVLGCILGIAARQGRDKLTLLASPGLVSVGAWLEQLVAESTGKQGRGILPLDGERIAPPERYGVDRLFVYLQLDGDPDGEQAAAVDRLAASGQPVVRIHVQDRYALGQEFFRWEFATAVAGSVLGVNPFDQPDVEASKVATRKLTAAFESGEGLPEAEPLVADGGLVLYTDVANAAALEAVAGNGATAGALLKAHLERLGAGDYFALLAYLERSEENRTGLQAIRHRVRDTRRVATCLGFGPRFLH